MLEEENGYVIKVEWHQGVQTTTFYEPILVMEHHVTCFCCSCPEDRPGIMDPYCRKHGWAGHRPCEEHSMLGEGASVQAIRAGRQKI